MIVYFLHLLIHGIFRLHGNDSNDGQTETTPKLNINNLINSGDFSFNDKIIMLDGLYPFSNTSMIITKPCQIIAKNPGKVACFMGTRYEWTKSADYNNVYYTDTTNVVNCYDMTDYNYPVELQKVDSIEEVNNTEGSYYTSSSRIYVNMNYYVNPTSDNIAVIRSYGEAFSRILDNTATSNWTVFFKDLIFVGSQNFAFRIDYKSDNIKHLFIAENCKFLYGQYVNSGSETIEGSAGGVRIEHGNAILKNCITSLNQR